MRFLDRLGQDVRYALRSARKRPLYAGTIIVTLALAIGANTAVFSVINSVVLEPLPYPDPDRLVAVGRGAQVTTISYPDLSDWRRETSSLHALAGYTLARETFVGEDLAEEWTGVESTPDLFTVLGSPPLLGRTLRPGIDRIGSDALVISHRLWQGRFGGDPNVIGRTVKFEDVTRVIVGVMPPDFYFPTATEDYWAPISSTPFFGDVSWIERRGTSFLHGVGRLASGRTVDEAQTEVAAIAHRIDTGPEGELDLEDDIDARVVGYHTLMVGDTRPLFALLAGAVALVLAIACANIANLTLTQATNRRQEFAVRRALGAGGFRVAAQTVTEHLVLAAVGGALGLLVAHLAVDLLLAVGPETLPRRQEIVVDRTAFAFAAVVAIVCGTVLGVLPLIRHRAASLSDTLRDGGRHGVSRTGRRVMSSLAVAQVALAVILTVGAGLLLNSFLRLTSVEPGFAEDHALTMQLQLPRSRYSDPAGIGAYYDNIRERLTDLPGITHVAYTSTLPFSGSNIGLSYYLPGDSPDTDKQVQLEVVQGDYFQAMGIPLLQGRGFDATDRPDAPIRVVINHTLAELHWPDRSPIGERLTFDDEFPDDRWMTIVGVTDDVLRRGLNDQVRPMVYLDRGQFSSLYSFISGRNGYLVIQTTGDPATRIDMILEGLRSVDPHIPFTEIRTTRELVQGSVAEPRFRTVLIGSFAALAVVVALVGIYGVLAFGVAQREHELGVRMALGADAARVVRHILADGGRLLVIGLPLGILGAILGGRVLEAMLFHITAADPTTLVVASLLFGAMALAASYFPARRAGRLDPVTTLRRE